MIRFIFQETFAHCSESWTTVCEWKKGFY